MSFVQQFYPESRFGGFTDVDGSVAFYSRINALLKPDSLVLDVGCGRGQFLEDAVVFRRQLRNLRGKVARVIGLDVDEAAQDNPSVDEFRRLDGRSPWPVEDASVDLLVSDCTLEHVPQPIEFFSEIQRVLRPGGVCCLRTSNSLSYVGLAARLVPNRLHAKVLVKVQEKRKAADVFPTVYRCNTIAAVRRQMDRHNFEHVVYGYESEPYYLQFSKLAYALGVLHQRLCPHVFKPAIFAFGRKPTLQN